MIDKSDTRIHYKWDPQTHTGFTLRFDAEGAAAGGHCCFHVEDWACRTVINEWPCADLDEALAVLSHFFSVDIGQERARLSAWLPDDERVAA